MGYRIEYDEIYNRTSMSREGMPVKLPAAFTNDPAYNAANRLTTFNSNSVSHDENGNMTGWGSTAYTWDEFNRLVAINGTSLDASYKYDALGRRIEKTINNTTTKYLYDGADIVLEMNENDAATIYYIRTLSMDEPLARIDLDSGGNVTGIRFYLADALGSFIALTDENGDIKTRYNYTPFGEVEVSGDSSDNPFMFTGREYDDGTGLYYYRARYYSWELGRFISEDPIGLAGGINMYAYVGNSPLNWIDPWGLKLNVVNYTGSSLEIDPNNVIKKAQNQIISNPKLLKWFNDALANKGKKIEDILSGDLEFEVGIYCRPWYSGPGQVRWDGVFVKRWLGQPNKSIGLKSSLFDASWYRTDAGDERKAAEILIHEIAHIVEAYAYGEVWAGKPSGYYDTGAYVESLIDW